MIGYPYTYGDYLSGEEAIRRRVEFVDKALVLVVCWSLSASILHARGFPANKTIGNEAPDGPTGSPTFAPIVGLCTCASPEVKTAILLVGVAAICSNDKPLIVACSALATYAGSKLSK